MLRLFAAVEVPPEAAEELTWRMRDLPGARWQAAEKLHVTLRFYGDVQEDRAADLDAELARVVQPPFDLTLAGVGSFGEGHQARTIWAGLEDSEPLRVLAGRCERAAKRAGLKPDARAYRPHVTLAYLKTPDPVHVAAWLSRHALLKTAPLRVTWFGLWSSVLHPDGSRYALEREYGLG